MISSFSSYLYYFICISLGWSLKMVSFLPIAPLHKEELSMNDCAKLPRRLRSYFSISLILVVLGIHFVHDLCNCGDHFFCRFALNLPRKAVLKKKNVCNFFVSFYLDFVWWSYFFLGVSFLKV